MRRDVNDAAGPAELRKTAKLMMRIVCNGSQPSRRAVAATKKRAALAAPWLSWSLGETWSASEVDLRADDDLLDGVKFRQSVGCAVANIGALRGRNSRATGHVTICMLVDQVEARIGRLDVLHDAPLPGVHVGGDFLPGLEPASS